MKVFLDHNMAAPAIANLGGITCPNDILTARSKNDSDIEVLRYTIENVMSGALSLVYSEYTLDTLFRVLIRGGSDFEAIDEQSALESIAVLRALSKYSKGLVSDGEVYATLPKVQTLVAAHTGRLKNQVDHEDHMVVSTLLAATGGEEAAALISEDGGFVSCAPKLGSRFIGVINRSRFMRASGIRTAA